ncbi:hypothetical protein PMAYCL1PPCAC_05185, partial [Pristionchus mayeri]
FDRCMYWNIDSWKGTGQEKGIMHKERWRVLEEYVQKYEPVLIKLNEIQDVKENVFKEFVENTLKYDVIALSYPNREHTHRTVKEHAELHRAAVILVRQ